MGGWTLLGDINYRKVEVYEMQWRDVDLEKYIVAGAQYGGPIATIRDERKAWMLGMTGDEGAQPHMRIFTSAGKLIADFIWQHKGLVAMGWSAREELVCVLEDGTVYMYSMHGDKVSVFNLGPECKDSGVAEVFFWGDGLVVRTGHTNQLVAILSFSAPHPFKLANPNPHMEGKPPTSMVVLPPAAPGGKPDVFLATAGGTVILADGSAATDKYLKTGPYVRMAVSPCREQIALFNDAGDLHVLSIDCKTPLGNFSTDSRRPPKDMAWCGSGSVVLYWSKMLLMVSPVHGDFVKYSYEGPLVLFPECDGVRLVSKEKCELLQPVHVSTDDVFGEDCADSSAAMLFSATTDFDNKNVDADDKIRMIKGRGELAEAIDRCLEAATHEFDFLKQRALLKSASFGKLFCDDYTADKFVDMCRILRVLNAVRHEEVAIPLTFEQYSRLGAEVVVDRLISRHMHLLALRICKFMLIPLDHVLVHWACAKIKNADEESDEDLCKLIREKLQVCPGVSFSQIASAAYHDAGRPELAVMLLEYEPLAMDQVPLLISMKQDGLALTKAVQSGDTDLVYTALLQIQKTHPKKEFFKIIQDKPLAKNLFIAYCKQQDLATLRDFYYHLHLSTEAAGVFIREAYEQTDWEQRLVKLEMAKSMYANDKANTFAVSATEEQVQLLKYEKQCQETYVKGGGSSEATADSFIDASVSGLMEKHIRQGDVQSALKVKSAFNVGEKRLWHVQVKTLAKCARWKELKDLGSNKKAPPIGFEPFVEACVEQKALGEAAQYIKQLGDPHKQMEWLCTIGYWKEAADIAAAVKDVDALRTIRQSCRTPQVQQQIDRWLAGGLGS